MTDDIVNQSPSGSEDMSCNSEGILSQGLAVYQSHVQGCVGSTAPLGEEPGQGNCDCGRMFAESVQRVTKSSLSGAPPLADL